MIFNGKLIMNLKFCLFFIKKIFFFGFIFITKAQQTHINLKQGTLVGLKVFPDATRAAVYAFLGVPYAEPPVDQLRFSFPKFHMGWNRTLLAMTMKPVCPQLLDTIYDEAANEELLARPAETSEDCLYLNIWVPENGLRNGNLPVLVVLTGEDMSYDWSRNRITGLDLAAEGFVVITIQYRTNIFGWLSIPGNNEIVGNFGLQDQSLALKWIQQNVKSLGGNPNQITLLGHGTSGAACAFLQYLINYDLWHTSAPPFNQLVLMSSGNIERSFKSTSLVQEASKAIVEKLGCQFEEQNKQLVSCLRSKSINDLLKAFESVYDHGNGTLHLGPTMDKSFNDFVSNSTIMSNFPTTIVGITSNEGAFLQDLWLELARESYSSLKSYINNTILRQILQSQNQFEDTDSKRYLDALNWRYFIDDYRENPVYLLASMERFLSEYNYEIPFYRLLNNFSNMLEAGNSNNNKLYAYIYDFKNSMDIRGKVNLFGGSSHTADLPLLFGPTLFQQIARRRFNSEEEKMYRKMRSPLISFIKSGIPTPVRGYDGWLPYTFKKKFIYDLGEKWSAITEQYTSILDKKNMEQISQLLLKDQSTSTLYSRPNRNDLSNLYQMPHNRQTSTNYVQNSPYTSHLIRVYRFWEVFLPQFISKSYSKDTDTAITQHLLFIEASADAARFKHGFFIMLGLVLILLALLCLCVYLLRRDPLASSPHFDCDL